MSKQPESAKLNSEKTKDIRMTNIIAARGILNTHLISCISCCRRSAYITWTTWNGQNGKYRYSLEYSITIIA